MKVTQEKVTSLYGSTVQDSLGKKVGTVGQVWTDAAGQPNWVSVKTGLFGRRESMVPLEAVEMERDHLSIPFDKEVVKKAPQVDTDADQPLSDAEVDELYAHYDLEPAPAVPSPPEPTRAQVAQEELTRSEERLRVGKESRPAGTARLRKYVVSEDVHTSVPVEHDEVRLEREPITEDNRGSASPEIGDVEREFALTAERPVVSKERVPLERVRLTEEQVTEDQAVDEELRSERIEAELPERSRSRRGS
ncbi:PRC and DUF2382 domain-containing protein [Micromonospora sp. LOL_021]|uniref:PRC and DUF2382 domain-containing protein n=1 Tax=Micromonospora sp. LOL_021 TaxID=3345417 RepID=UPI003A8B2348